MQKPLSISQCLNTSVLLQYLFICFSITSACMQSVISPSNSSLSLPCQIKYQEPGIIHTFVRRFLLHQGISLVKLKHWYFLLASKSLSLRIYPSSYNARKLCCYHRCSQSRIPSQFEILVKRRLFLIKFGIHSLQFLFFLVFLVMQLHHLPHCS